MIDRFCYSRRRKLMAEFLPLMVAPRIIHYNASRIARKPGAEEGESETRSQGALPRKSESRPSHSHGASARCQPRNKIGKPFQRFLRPAVDVTMCVQPPECFDPEKQTVKTVPRHALLFITGLKPGV